MLLSAGHGWYWNEEFAAWHLQRDHFWGIVEDVVNWEFASELQTALRTTRFDARLARNPDRLAGPGPSGHPGWQEAAVYFIKGLGAPAEVWNIGASSWICRVPTTRRCTIRTSSASSLMRFVTVYTRGRACRFRRTIRR